MRINIDVTVWSDAWENPKKRELNLELPDAINSITVGDILQDLTDATIAEFKSKPAPEKETEDHNAD